MVHLNDLHGMCSATSPGTSISPTTCGIPSVNAIGGLNFTTAYFGMEWPQTVPPTSCITSPPNVFLGLTKHDILLERSISVDEITSVCLADTTNDSDDTISTNIGPIHFKSKENSDTLDLE